MRTKTDAIASAHGGFWGALALAIAMFAGFCGLGAEAAAASHVASASSLQQSVERTYASLGLPAAPAATPTPVEALVWRGVDIDGDGQPDFANPTGQDIRGCDAFGCGSFGADRDAGGRRHEGTDFEASAGQKIVAPISGFVSKIGAAYPGDARYHYVQITNPALHYEARVFYVDPSVHEGQAVHLGQPIGRDHSLEPRYPGITNHVHLEIERIGGPKLDATRFIAEQMEPVDPTTNYAQAAAPADNG
ncbi:MAG TPA: M23 family metallopeptidase [Caulobacteraceae bacterium]|nr:M23 family metallopeptidase [Caulobacteraceae bacterium]